MPTSPPSLCTTPGCGHLAPTGGPCPDCRTERRNDSDAARGSSTERGYDRVHRTRFRRGVLDRDRVCVICRTRLATIADHYPLSRRELLERGLDPNDPANGRGLCAVCDPKQTAQRQPGGWNARRREPRDSVGG